MEKNVLNEIFDNAKKIIKVKGFYIILSEESLINNGIDKWSLEKEFYFDSENELQNFKNGLKILMIEYFGKIEDIFTYEEYQLKIENDLKSIYKLYPISYLIREREAGIDNFKQVHSANYAHDIGTAIHRKLPAGIDETNRDDVEVIKSTEPRFNEILYRESQRLETEINLLEKNLDNAKMNLRLIQNELKFNKRKENE